MPTATSVAVAGLSAKHRAAFLEMELLYHQSADTCENPDSKDRSRLLARTYALLDERRAAHGMTNVDCLTLKDAFMSIQSSLGHSSERILSHYADQQVDADAERSTGRRLRAYRTSDQFKAAIADLRACWNDAAPGARAVMVREMAQEFFVTDAHVRTFVTDRKKHKTYPDSVSVFSDGTLIIAEHKLSGQNDSKAIAKNIDVLMRLRASFDRDGQQVSIAVALPFTDTDRRTAARWENAGLLDHVACNEDVWALLLGTAPASAQVYDETLELLADIAANRLLFKIGNGAVAFTADTATGRWQVQASSVSAQLPPAAAAEQVPDRNFDALVELAAAYGCSVVRGVA